MTTNLDQLTEFDVLCGRGKKYYSWCGNQRFRSIVDESIESYDKSESKPARSIIIIDIVDSIVAEGGRFLRKTAKSGQWMDIGKKAACEKVGQTIRDALVMKDPERHALKIVTRGLLEAKREVRKSREGTTPQSTQCLFLSMTSHNWDTASTRKKDAGFKEKNVVECVSYITPSISTDVSCNISERLPHCDNQSSTVTRPTYIDLDHYHAHPTTFTIASTENSEAPLFRLPVARIAACPTFLEPSRFQNTVNVNVSPSGIHDLFTQAGDPGRI